MVPRPLAQATSPQPPTPEPVEPVIDDTKSVKRSEKSYKSVAASRKSSRSARPSTVGQAIASTIEPEVRIDFQKKYHGLLPKIDSKI